MATQTKPVPASRILEKVMGEVVILVDTREQMPLQFENFPTERATLNVGDYGIRGFSNWDNPAFIVERKSLDDLVASLTSGRDRFFRELEKMRAFRFAAIVIEATENDVDVEHYRSYTRPESILQSLAAIQVRMGVHVIWAGSPEGAARCVENLVRQFARGIVKDVGRFRGQRAKAVATC